MALDTEQAKLRLMAVGLEEPVANEVAYTIGEATKDLATKQDVADIKQLIAELRADMGKLEGKFYRHMWLLGMGLIVAGTAILGIHAAILVALLG